MTHILLNTADIVTTSWNQLKAEQAAFVLQMRSKLTDAVTNEQYEMAGKFKAILVAYLSKNKITRELTAEQVNDVADDLKFIYQPWHHFHVTYIKTKYGKLLAPEIKMASLTFWQMVLADAEYSKFLVLNHRKSNGQLHSLNRLIAILYHPELGTFNDDLIDEISVSFPKGLTFDLKYLILHTYSNIRKYIVDERCTNLFAAPPDTGSKTYKPQYTGKMWQDLLFDLSDTPAFPGLDRAKKARLYDALDYLEKKAFDYKPK